MSITVTVRTLQGVHSLDLPGDETLQHLYRKTANATGFADGSFVLYYEGAELESDPGKQIQDTGLSNECELTLSDMIGLHIRLEHLPIQKNMIMTRVESDPNLLVVVNASNVAGGVLDLAIVFSYILTVRNLKLTDPMGQVTSISAMGSRDTEEWMYSLSPFATKPLNISFDLPKVTSIGSNFLASCFTGPEGRVDLNVDTVDLSGLTSVTSVGDQFLFHSCLTSVVLPPSLRKISNGFLSHSRGMKKVDLSPLKNVRSIGDFFLSMSGVKTVDLSSLTNLREIGNSFFSGSLLTTIDLSQLRRVETIGNGFLTYTKISSIDLAPLAGVRRIGDDFLAGCEALREIDLRPLKNVEIGGDFLADTGVPEKDRVANPGCCCLS